jgi:flagellar motor switch protein FliN/FliY
VITPATSPVTGLLATAAATVAGTLASSEPLAAGEATRDLGALEASGHAVLAQFTGPVTGEIVLVVDDELYGALRESTLGPLELVAALTPTIESVAVAIGPVVLGQLQETEARLAVHRVLAHTDSGLTLLNGASAPRAAVAIGIDTPSADAPAAPVIDRLDLLRGVEMEATAELGRAKMTINDLLSLHNGAVIELDRVAGAPADLFVNGRLIARGEVVVVDENYGLRITQVVSDDSGR